MYSSDAYGILTQIQIESEGLDVAEILKSQMEKIEELTLYIIQLQNQLDQLK
ncbi:MAG: hypothetical protein IPP71_12400 [Bacteroidetes bacterium]|nr:hypothetical protein [Bacteroidota bacterium]